MTLTSCYKFVPQMSAGASHAAAPVSLGTACKPCHLVTFSPQMSAGTKRDRNFLPESAAKRQHVVAPTARRLIDDEHAYALIEDEAAGSRAKTKGWITNRSLSATDYAEVCAA